LPARGHCRGLIYVKIKRTFNPQEEKMAEGQESRLMEALKIIGTVTGLVGGVAGVFAIVGYVIILAFANENGIYGRTNFTQQLPFESLFSALFDWIKFCGKNTLHFAALLSASLLVFVAFLPDMLKKDTSSKDLAPLDLPMIILTTFGMIVGLLMIIAIGHYDIRQTYQSVINKIDDYLLYSIAVPLLAGLIIILVTRYRTAFPNKYASSVPPKKNRWYSAALCVFVAILFLMPFMYGTAFYDLPLNKMRAPIFADSLLNNQVGSMFPNDFTSFYFGQASDQCLFLTNDQSLNGWRIRTIPKDQLRSIELLRTTDELSLTLRKYYSIFYQFQNAQTTINKLQEAAEKKRETSSEFDSTLTDFINKK
jgi:hypothetical protein